MTTKNLYPNSVPSLDLNFAKLKRLDPRVTFTRASTGTYVGADGLVKTAASGVARFDHNGATGESLGLLVEEARTNLVTQSQTFSTWTLGNASITTNVTTSPDGTNNASKLIEDSTANIHRISRSIDPTGAHTISVFAKAAERNILTLMPASTGGGDTPVYFNLSNGTISTSLGSATSASIQGHPNGWYRCSVTDTMGGFGYPFIGVAAVSGTHSYTGDGTSGIYIWGAQLEAGSFPTSYIPTTTATVTRAADVASMTGTNFSSWYNVNQGTLFAALRLINTSQGGVIGPINSSNVDINEGLVIQASTAQLRALNYLDSGSTNNDIVNNTPAIGVNKIAVAGSTTDDATGVYFNALTGLVNASRAQGFSNVAGLKIGDRGGQRLNGTIARLAYYPVRLPDAQLQALTAT
jgi:hypothetical protein